ncbi:MAG: AraC family transcriptional regulator, partial [Candidatus Ruminococcus intestinipullorum]|nr:AraC family transcriptional regulator [Candidatus Ruminococcus intestinipullorum]
RQILDMKEGNFLKDFLIDALCGKSRNTSYLYFHVADILPIQNLIENMVWTIRNEQPNKRRCNQITMGLLLLQLLNHMDRMEAGKGVYEKELMDMVHEYIEAHYKNGSLSELSAILGYDLYWLSREIKKRAGKTYKDLLLDKRMKQTAYLLKETTLPVVDIIESIGYDNTSYFYKKFKETYGVSPKEYREGKNNEQNL